MPDGHRIRVVDALQPGWRTNGQEEIAVAPPVFLRSDHPELFHARADVEWGGMLLLANFAIRADGIVAMLEDEPLGRLVRRETH